MEQCTDCVGGFIILNSRESFQNCCRWATLHPSPYAWARCRQGSGKQFICALGGYMRQVWNASLQSHTPRASRHVFLAGTTSAAYCGFGIGWRRVPFSSPLPRDPRPPPADVYDCHRPGVGAQGRKDASVAGPVRVSPRHLLVMCLRWKDGHREFHDSLW